MEAIKFNVLALNLLAFGSWEASTRNDWMCLGAGNYAPGSWSAAVLCPKYARTIEKRQKTGAVQNLAASRTVHEEGEPGSLLRTAR